MAKSEPTDLETFTDMELLDEMSRRYDKFVAIRPARRVKGRTVIYCRTSELKGEAPFELISALNLIYNAQIGLIKNCFTKFVDDDYDYGDDKNFGLGSGDTFRMIDDDGEEDDEG